MRIAQIAPLSERVPPGKYGGTERVVYALTEELVKRGHDVTLFASGNSSTSAKLSSIYPFSLRETGIRNPYGFNELTMYHLGNAYKKEADFDIIHDHNFFGLLASQFVKTPTLLTLHGAVNPLNKKLFNFFNKTKLIAISNNQASQLNGRVFNTIYNGLEMKKSPFKKTPGKYLLIVGRISMAKGVHHAIDVALSLNLPLIIAAKVDEVDMDYFNFYIQPRLTNGQISFIGEVNQEERDNLMANALCLLHPVTWEEPFGLVMIEAMACGTPVVAFRKGSIPEVIEDKKTGFVVDNLEQMIKAVTNIKKIDRRYCRNYVLSKFNAKIMADRYELAYQNIIKLK